MRPTPTGDSEVPSRPKSGPPWTEMGLDGLLLGLFMVSACGFGALLEHPASPVHLAIPDPLVRRILMGVAMGLTAIALIYSSAGRRSGAHFNPAVTLAFASLGRVRPGVAAGYVAAQFAGGVAGVAIMAALIGGALAEPRVHYVVTRPGPQGVAAAFAAEAVISFVLFAIVLLVSRSVRFMRLTGIAAGVLVATWITFEAPVSGMSMNPARTLGSAALAGDWTAIWIYFVAPPLGMLLAAGLHHLALARHPSPTAAGACAKLDHDPAVRCIFCEAREREVVKVPRRGASGVSGLPAGGSALEPDEGRPAHREPNPARGH